MILSFENEAGEIAEFTIVDAPNRRAALKAAHESLRAIPGEHVWVLKKEIWVLKEETE